MFTTVYIRHGDHSDNTGYWKFRRHKAVEETLVSTSKENTYLKLKQKQKQKTMSKDKNLAYAGEENPFIYHIVSH